MDAQTTKTIETLAELGIIPPIVKQKGPRPAASYRAARRNHVKAHRKLPVWRQFTAGYANHKAGIVARQVVANGAREAAAKALVEAMARPGLPRDVVIASAVLDYYRDLPGKQTRPQSRIIRQLESQVRSTARKVELVA